MWACCTCKELKPATDYYKDSRSANGLKAQCKKCHSATSIATRDPELTRFAGVVSEANRRATKAGVSGRVDKNKYQQLASLLGRVCLKCGKTTEIQWDHITPLARGGEHSPVNLQPLCRQCNEHKQASTADYRSTKQIAAVAATWSGGKEVANA